MDKETLSNYGWIVICVLVLAVMIALATPFGTFVSGAVQSTTQGLFDVNQKALNGTGLINIGDQSFTDGDNGSSGGTGTETPSTPEETPTDPEPTECQHTNTTTINASSATCTVAGYSGDTYCNDCKNTTATGTSIPAVGHKNTTTINASTTYTGDTYCNDCSTTIATGETISQTTLTKEYFINKTFKCDYFRFIFDDDDYQVNLQTDTGGSYVDYLLNEEERQLCNAPNDGAEWVLQISDDGKSITLLSMHAEGNSYFNSKWAPYIGKTFTLVE